MKIQKLKKLLSVLLVFTQLGITPLVYADTTNCEALRAMTSDCSGECQCNKICACLNDKYQSAIVDISTDQRHNPGGNDLKTVKNMASGAGVMVQLKAYCDAYDVEKDIPDKLVTEIGLASGAAAACLALAGCWAANSANPIAWGVCTAMSVACDVLGISQLGVDLANIHEIGKKAATIDDNYGYLDKEIEDAYQNSSPQAVDITLGAAGAAAGTGMVVASVKATRDAAAQKATGEAFEKNAKAAEKAVQEAADETAKKALQETATEATEKLAEHEASTAARKTPVAGIAAALLSFGLIFPEAVMKGLAHKKVKGLPDETCRGAIKPVGTSAASFLLEKVNTIRSGRSSTKQGAASSGSTGTTDGGGTPDSQNTATDTESSHQGSSNALALDRMKELNQTKFNPDAIDKVLKDNLNTSLEDIAKKVRAGVSPADIIAQSMPSNIPDSIKTGMLEHAKHIDGNYKSPLEQLFPGSAIMTGGGGRGGGRGDGGAFASLMNFGKSGDADLQPGAGGKIAEIAFSGKRKVASGIEDTDIYHSKWTGSIFQLISIRLDKGKLNLAQLEWIGLFNRAMHGLPPTLPETLAKPKQSVQPQSSPQKPQPLPSPHKPVVPEFIQNGT